MINNEYFDENEFMLGEEDEVDFAPAEIEKELKHMKKYFKKNKFRAKRLYIAS